MMVPQDDFTPHGYLDNPYHSWKLNPNGVLRSLKPLGMGWHVPNLGSYVRNQFQYTAHLSLGLRIGKQVMITPEDFQRHGCAISCHLHTKNRFEYTCFVPQHQLKLTARYFLIQEHALGCVLSFSTTASQQLPVICYLLHRHTHNPHTSRLWEHGLYSCPGSREDSVMLGIASEGDVFVHGARPADSLPLTFEGMGYVVSLGDASAWAQGREVASPSITQSQRDTGWQVRTVILPCRVTLGDDGGPTERIIHVVLARGVSADQSFQHWEEGMQEIARAEEEHRAEDERFWSRAPQLAGDWPASWRRGWVYDFETLRMVMRPAVGLIPHVFDGMQIQAPRLVLAEAAMDTLLLSYADPELAKEVILGHFEAAPHPNLPCMREDGSYNMVADDGQICGTAPAWGFPLWCCDQLFRRTGDLQWLRRLYPRAAAYLRWWLEHRRDAEGWLVYACSWESGQDVSSRFGPQQTGGTSIEHVRPVDLQASMAQAAQIMARWAIYLAEAHDSSDPADLSMDFPAEAAWWENVGDAYTARTRSMWQQGCFRDYDAATGEWSSQPDAMHLAPVFCGVADRDQLRELRPSLVKPPLHSNGWAPLSWPPVVMTLVGAADTAEMPGEAAELAYRFIEAAYRSSDSRELEEHEGLPGVTREYHTVVTTAKWGASTYSNAGIEGYGWGALSIHLLIRYLLGVREDEVDRLSVRPILPQAFRRTGATYQAGPVPWGGYPLRITCTVKDAQTYRLNLWCAAPTAGATLESPQQGVTQQQMQEFQCDWEAAWGEGRTLRLPDLTIVSL